MGTGIGEKLQRARRSREISLEEVSRDTKIPQEYLEALEEERYDVFPGRIYIISFLRAYARYLGLDTELLVQTYLRSHAAREEMAGFSPRIPLKMGTSVRRVNLLKKYLVPFFFLSARKKFIRFLLVVILLVIVGLALLFVYNSPQKIDFSERPAWSFLRRTFERAVERITVAAEATGDCRLQVVSDDTIAFEGVLRSGQKRKWKGQNKIILKIGDVEHIKVWVNGQEVDLVTGSYNGLNEMTISKGRSNGQIRIIRKNLPETDLGTANEPSE